ncbi:MAG: Amidase enhancer precursor [Firmicutes bacterium ADurb.Bin182]|nr:MAG: Amidase enhancer precursor [Firmicutes bacterium ADurb.Bin182]
MEIRAELTLYERQVNMRKRRFFSSLCLALLLVLPAVTARAAVFYKDVRVLLSLDKQTSVFFTPVGRFTLKEAPGIAVGNDELEIRAVGGRVSLSVGSKTVTAASITLLSGGYGKKEDYIRLKNARYGTCTYLGNMTFDVFEGGIRAVNTLPMEQYLYGVVPYEMSNSFPIEALKAQAVCARSFAAARCSRYFDRAYDIRDTSDDQVYHGYASKNARAIAAVDATVGQVLTYEGDIIEAFYSASNGGQTEKTGNVWSSDFPYYVNADDPFDILNASSLEERSFIPEKYCERTLKLMDRGVLQKLEQAAYEAAGREVNLIETVYVMPKNPSYGEPSRCYTEADVTLVVGFSEDGLSKTGQLTVTLSLEDLNFGSFENMFGKIGAKKTRLRMRGAERGSYRSKGETHGGYFLTERRYGHGVGLSQRGAQERARFGQCYTDILSFYYANTALASIGSFDSAPKITSGIYSIDEWGVSGVSEGTTAETMLKNLSSQGELSLVNSKGVPAVKIVGTGCFVRVAYREGTAFFDLPVVIFGDLDGDGKIESDDVSALQSHLAHETMLTGARISAADVDRDGSVDISDLLLLIQTINGDAEISQGGKA